MAGPILYQPRRSWRSAAAFVLAALIHFAAIAFASIHQHEEETELPPGEDSFPPVVLTTETPFDNAVPPPDVADPSPAPNPTDESFPHEKGSPPPIRQQDRRPVAPIVKAVDRAPGLLTLSSARIMTLNAPRPQYPYEARRQKITGNGIVMMSVDPVSGSVTDVSMWQSTGSSVLDNATVAAFRRWRFKPGTVSKVKSPITFTMTGASY